MNDVRIPAAKEQVNGRLNFAPARNGMQRLMAWHRRLGLAAALIVLLLSVTGLLLNHTHRLGLDRMRVTANWLLDWYGIPTDDHALGYRAGDRWLLWNGAGLYLDDKPVAETAVAPVGAAALPDGMLAVAFPDMLILLASDGSLVERIGPQSLPGPLERVAVDEGGLLVVATAAGRFLADAELASWRSTSVEATWSTPQEMPAALRERLSATRRPGLSAERVLQDLHSGRILGPWGPWLMDAAAIAFVVMAFTGIVYWWKRCGRAPQSPPGPFERRNGE
jgi:hypothetical protein